MKREILSACAALSLAGLSFAARPTEALPSELVRYADLNLDSSDGQIALYRRIARAAARVCNQAQGVNKLVVPRTLRTCRANALDRAIAELDVPALSALHDSRTGQKNTGLQPANKDRGA
jgi:UrcA family protein